MKTEGAVLSTATQYTAWLNCMFIATALGKGQRRFPKNLCEFLSCKEKLHMAMHSATDESLEAVNTKWLVC